jgi:hypothetical protein
MLAYEFQSLKRDSFPSSPFYEKTFTDFETIFNQQAMLRERHVYETVKQVFEAVKKKSDNANNDEFELLNHSDDTVVAGGHLTRFVATVQQIFDVPLFEVDYAFTRWNLEDKVAAHYKSTPSVAFKPTELFQTNSVRVKIFAKGEMHHIIETEFRKHEAEFNKLAKGFTIQVVE